MKKIRDILCFQTNYGEMYELDNSFTGKIMIKEDNSFEGLMTDFNREGIYFVFGNIEEDKALEMIRVTKQDIELPKIYRAEKEENRFFGDMSVKTRFTEVAIGECKVTVVDPFLYRDIDNKGEILGLEDRIHIFKSELGEESQGLLADYQKREKTYLKKNTQN